MWSAVIIGGLLVFSPLFAAMIQTPIDHEEAAWIRGDVLGSRTRLVQHLVLNRVCLPLFGTHYVAYRLPSLALHLLNAAMVGLLFVLYFGQARTALKRARGSLHAGGVAAAFLFLAHHNEAYLRVGSLSYQLALLFFLGGLVLGLLHLRRGAVVYWALVVVCYGLALASNAFALAMPLVFAFLEWSLRPGLRTPPRIAGTVARYLALVALLGLFLFVFQHKAGPLEELWRLTTSGDLLLILPRYLLMAALRFVPDVVSLPQLQGLDMRHASPGPVEVAALGMLLALGALGIRRLLRRSVGLLGTLLIYGLVWQVVFFPLAAAAQSLYIYHRYHLNGAGLALLAAAALAHLAARLPGRLHRAGALASGAVFVVPLAGMLLATPAYRDSVARLFGGPAGEGHFPAWRRCDHCRGARGLNVGGSGEAPSLRCADLRGLDLPRRGLGGRDLHGADLTGARLQRFVLTGAKLTHASLALSDLAGANLARADLRGADLSGASLQDAVLNGADLSKSEARWANMTDAQLEGARLEGADLYFVGLQRADLRRADLSRAVLWNCDLRYADLRGARMAGANIFGIQVEEAKYDETTVLPAELRPGKSGMRLVPAPAR